MRRHGAFHRHFLQTLGDRIDLAEREGDIVGAGEQVPGVALDDQAEGMDGALPGGPVATRVAEPHLHALDHINHENNTIN